MYRQILCCLFLFSFAAVMNAQKSDGGRPNSEMLPEQKSTSVLPDIKLKELDISNLTAESDLSHEPFRYGIFTDTIIDLKVAGKPDVITALGKIWRLKISNDNAKSIKLFFKRFVIPDGAKLFLYDENKRDLTGAFTNKNVSSDSTFVVADFKGDHVIAEYFEPLNARFSGKIIIGSVGQAYRDVLESESGSGSFININCPIGKNAQLDKHAVGRMAFRSGQYQVTCSGALINNVKNDGTPYFLTANHCLSTPSEASSLNVYFNYEIIGCDGDTIKPTVLSGSTLLSTAQPSDYTLLKLGENPDAADQPYFAGWDAIDNPAVNVTAVHYPFGNTKKISLDYDSIVSNSVSVTWDDDSRSPRGSHWVIGFDDGSTSQGSSGSPLFNSNHQIIGQLHGGDDAQAYYGKISYSFAHKPANFQSMAHYLDPDSTGALVINGYSPSSNIPDAFFITDFEQVCLNAPVTFTDYSVFRPFSKLWTITPETYTFASGTSDTSSNPVIQFLQAGAYNVKLNLLRADSVVSTESLNITSGNNLSISVKSNKPGDLCDCNFETLKMKASGAADYTWSIAARDTDKIVFSGDTGDTTTIRRLKDFKAQSSYNITFSVVGSQATCKDTITVTYDVLKPENDDIENAAVLQYGMSEYFTNICASVQLNEPVPPFSSCTSQNSWCDEYGTGENIVENSVWFKFAASSTGRVSITSTGFDNQIALYEADSANAILSGNYIILAANDDRSDSDFRPLIISEPVTPGKTYWIQADGSGGGLESEFYITLTELSATPVTEGISQNLAVYPVPTDDLVYFKNTGWTEHQARVFVYSTSGACMMDENRPISNQEIRVSTGGWEAGVYIVKIIAGNQEYVSRIVKR